MQNATNQENLLMAKTLRELRGIIQDLRTTFTETGTPIDDDNKDFHKFCAKLELILFQGTKEKTGLFGSNKRSPYDFFSAVLAKSKNANEGLKYVRYNAEIRTSTGKLRCFVRYSLFHGLFADAIQSCLSEQKAVSEFYDFSSVFSSRSLSESFVSALYDLNDIQFDLNPAGFELDAEWPTFAKKQFAGHNWKTPSVYSSPTSQSGSFTSFTSDVTSPRLLRRSFFSRSASETESSPMDHSDPEEQLSAAQQQIQLLTGANCKMEEEIKNLNEELRKAREVALNSESKLELLQNTHNLEISRLQQQIEELQQQIQTFETTNQNPELLPSGAEVEVGNEELETAKEEARSLRFQLSTQQLEYERSSQALEEQHKGLQGALDKQGEYEALIQGLREELHAVVNLANQEKTVFHNEMANMRLALMTREEECQGLSDELRATVAEKDEMHVELDNLRTQLLEMKESADKIQDRLQNELTALKDESQQLRRKVVTLIKEKDALWHRSDRLLQWHRILETDKWVPDQQVDKCQSCSNAFSFTLRRHHCRLCGRIFCYSCANVWLKTPGHRYKVRICNECYIVHNEASQIENNCNFNDSNDTEATDSGMVNTADDKMAENSGQNGPVAMETEIYEKICQEFTVISDEEIIKSLGESSPYTRSPLAGTDYRKIWIVAPRLADSLLEDSEMEVYLNAAMIYRIPIEISDPGFLLKWRVKTKPKSVVVVLLQQVPDATNEAAAEATESAERVDSVVVLTTTRVKSLPHFTEGQQLLQTPGTYFFDLDNSHSKFLAKKVTFSLCVQKTPSPNDAMDATS